MASALVTRPSRPVPSTAVTSRPFSARILLAAGEAAVTVVPKAAAAGSAGAAFSSAAGAAAVALASVSIRAKTSPAVTVLPSPFTISTNTPAEGAGTSSTTLSVSTSIKISSCSTASPGCFFHSSSVASDTDSESWGTRTSVIAMLGIRFLDLKDSLLGQHEALELGCHCRFEQGALLLVVLGKVTHGR